MTLRTKQGEKMKWFKLSIVSIITIVFLLGCLPYTRETSKVDNINRLYSDNFYVEKIKDAKIRVKYYWDSNLPAGKIILDMQVESQRGYQIADGKSFVLNVNGIIYKYKPVSDNLSDLTEKLHRESFTVGKRTYISNDVSVVREYSVNRQYLVDRAVLDKILTANETYFRLKTNYNDLEGSMGGWADKGVLRGYLRELDKETKQTIISTSQIDNQNSGESVATHQKATSFPSSMVVTSSKATLRKNPTKDAKVIKTLKKGEEVKMIQKKGNWFNVELSDGEVGWCHKSTLSQQNVNK
jgi:hypothetical protein